MLRFYIRLAATFILLLTISSIALIALGNTQPIHPALTGFVEGCEGIPQPCWYGIIVGRTSGTEAIASLEQRGFIKIVEFSERTYLRCSTYIGSARVTICITELNEYMASDLVFSLSLDDPAMRLGDLFSAVGFPRRVYMSGNSSPILAYSSQMEVHLYETQSFANLTLGSQVSAISMHMEEHGGPDFEWHGLYPLWHYCQFEPLNEVCI